ncbi:fibronectin type III domain-containing protein [Chryseobacterium chendengshani]|uniref:fibronectin type III domain-containing protein n=1 Tax=unclassified Chryseobacterium TaxID=2593645 RepID=UPI001C644941|nr:MULTISPECIES: fibronectin type III domain-containing protein [unclassified Chryseobacterium]MBW7674917.1 fibronectin type III domain-containing protein [Chryseobacterium sp. LJ756]MBW8523470.1 fibronectin type III domain-containing protein [Chryseobacterium sp. LJ668]QYK15756.1 fibronectin type III domain-containing protein [Chryseobacterium sp. LJ668]
MVKKFTSFIFLLCLMNVGFMPLLRAQAPATLPYTQDFNTSNDFTLLSGTQANKWVYGAAVGNLGSSIYISNDNGVTNGYTNNIINVSQAYRDIAIPAGTTAASPATLSFNWRAEGEGCCDYLRVWLVPSTFTPTPGTQIAAGAGRIQLGGNLNAQGTWQTYLNTNINLASFAGTNMRLVFEWRNDGSLGTPPAGAIDNINMLIPTCAAPTALAVNAITTTNATISWTGITPVPANGYQYYISTSSASPTTGTIPTGTTTGTSVSLTTLLPSTTYYFWVRAVCSSTDSSIWSAGPQFSTTQIPAIMPYSQNFTTVNDFGFVNGSQVNKWFYGNAAGNAPNSIYISNDNGVTNDYTITSLSVVQAYRDIAVPAGTTAASPALLTFDWLAQGESCCDYLRVWLVPSSFTPTAGTQITAGAGRIQVGGNLNLQSAWQSYLNTNVNLATFAGTTVRLVFEWRNDGSLGTAPAGAIDNINLLIPTCKIPTAMAVGTVTSVGATISWTATTPPPGIGYQYYVSTSPTPPVGTTVPTGTTTATSVILNTLVPNTTYYWWVRAACSATDRSIWVGGPSFTTTQIPATIPYVQPFTTNDFGFVNGTQVNKWVFGNAAGNPANSIYVSNDNGVTNAYTITSLSTVHAYRDVAVPAGTTIATLSFNWKAQGETTLDYLRVWLVPASFVPVAGTQITAGAGRIQVGANFNQQSAWQTYSNTNLNVSTFAGTTMRLVFEWRNNASVGTQQPAAVDNVVIRICKTTTPVVTIAPASITHNSATLTWAQDNGGADYKIRYRPVGTTQWLPVSGPIDVASVPGTTQTYLLGGLSPVTLYEVEVAAVCNVTNIGTYSHNEFTTKCDPTPPNVTITNVTSTSAVVTWNPLVASASYELQWREVGTIPWNTPAIPQPPANSYTITGLTSFKTYEVQVRSKCIGAATPNPWSNPQVFTTVRICEIPPPGLTITTLTPTSAEIVWDAFPGATYVLRYRKVGIPSWTNIPVNVNTYTITGLLELTKYEMEVANVCNGTPGNYTLPYYFITPTVLYCQMSSASFAAGFIEKVTAKPTGKPEMINESLGSTYTDYTGFTGVPVKYIEMIQGSSGNQITIDKNLGSGTSAGVAVWIDFNRNGYFDINERVLADGPNTNPTASATFSVPVDAFVSMTDYKYVTMRVAMQKDGIPVNCLSFADGEVEDYTVRISKQPVAGAINQTEILIYPNPVSTVLNVKNISKKANYKIYSAAGQMISSGLIVNNKIDVSRLINGLYVIDIEDVNGTVQKKFIKE